MADINITRVFDLLNAYRNEFKGLNKAFSEKRSGKWKNYSATDYVRICDELSLAFLEIGIKKGDKIATVMHNSPEWNFIDMAIAQTGAVHVPIYPTISNDSFEFIFKDAGVKHLMISNKEVYDRIEPILQKIDSYKGSFRIDFEADIPTLDDLLKIGSKSNRKTELTEIKNHCRGGRAMG